MLTMLSNSLLLVLALTSDVLATPITTAAVAVFTTTLIATKTVVFAPASSPTSSSLLTNPLYTSTTNTNINTNTNTNTSTPYTPYGCARSSTTISLSWPTLTSWLPFSTLFTLNTPLILSSSAQFSVPATNPLELTSIHTAILSAANSTGLDARFILAILLQESGGCVRAPTTNYGVRNPGLMQDHDGAATCNSDVTGAVSTPCPDAVIAKMVMESVAGTASGDGLVQCLARAEGKYAMQGAMAYYGAARLYNSGAIDQSGCLEGGGATHCYASDVANRLVGWDGVGRECGFDG